MSVFQEENMRFRKLYILCFAALLLLNGCKSPASMKAEAVKGGAEDIVEMETEPEDKAGSGAVAKPPDSLDEFVRVRDYIPDIMVDLRYSTENNFTGTVIYDFNDAWLRYGTVKKLKSAQELLSEKGYSICIWDAFRPAEAQNKLWEVYPDGNYVSNPANGYSGHTRGDTVDITLVTKDGELADMPSGFDDFTKAADRDYSDVTEKQAESAELLEYVMERSGFESYGMEWWHYSDADKHEPELEFVPPEY